MYYINSKTGVAYAGDMQPGDRPATDAEIAEITRDKRTYAEKRFMEYPSIGDMIDAMCKAAQGDHSELDMLMARRASIKAKYPKE